MGQVVSPLHSLMPQTRATPRISSSVARLDDLRPTSYRPVDNHKRFRSLSRRALAHDLTG